MPYVMFSDVDPNHIHSFIHSTCIGHIFKTENVHFWHFGGVTSAGRGSHQLQQPHVHNWGRAIAENGSKERHRSRISL